jgi:hypothetical protein
MLTRDQIAALPAGTMLQASRCPGRKFLLTGFKPDGTLLLSQQFGYEFDIECTVENALSELLLCPVGPPTIGTTDFHLPASPSPSAPTTREKEEARACLRVT